VTDGQLHQVMMIAEFTEVSTHADIRYTKKRLQEIREETMKDKLMQKLVRKSSEKVLPTQGDM